MKTYMSLSLAVLFALSVKAEMRTWTDPAGKAFEAEYVKMLFDDAILRDANGSEIRIPVEKMSATDRKYVELRNPPELSVDFMKSEDQEFIPLSPFPTGGAVPDPPTLLIMQFGARVKQLSGQSYAHPLKIEIYAFTQQRYDQDKYHLIAKEVSKPFVLSKENDYRHEFISERKHDVLRYELYVDYLSWRETRGEKYGESLILVRDERGEIVAYNTTKNWIYNNLDNLEKLPVGAWLDKTCTRVHPTSPKITKKPGASWL